MRMSSVSRRSPKDEAGWLVHRHPASLKLRRAGMETADVTVQAAVARRLAFLDTLAWEVRATEGADPALAQEQAELLR
jgi:hypothetical protein